ncbi:MAG: hypothetical protein V3V10_03645 [Planctomycetota bacterium]
MAARFTGDPKPSNQQAEKRTKAAIWAMLSERRSWADGHDQLRKLKVHKGVNEATGPTHPKVRFLSRPLALALAVSQ